MLIYPDPAPFRLGDFKDTPSSRLSIDEFLKIDLEQEHDPPCFLEAKKKAKNKTTPTVIKYIIIKKTMFIEHIYCYRNRKKIVTKKRAETRLRKRRGRRVTRRRRPAGLGASRSAPWRRSLVGQERQRLF